MNRVWSGVPGAGARLLAALACGAGAVLLAAGALPAREDGGAVISLSIVPNSSQAHVVIGVDGAVTVTDFPLRNPDRIVVDITGARLGVGKGRYDRIARGGVVDVRYAQNQPNVVRVVVTLTGPKKYEVRRALGEVRVSIDGGGQFAAWRVGHAGATSSAFTKARPVAANLAGSVGAEHAQSLAEGTPAPAPASAPVAQVTSVVSGTTTPLPGLAQPQQQPQQQPQERPRITISWEKADIRDVLAAFAARFNRTIIPSRGVEGTITAEIVDKPWDVALRAILRANGFDAIEDENGIILVNTIEALQAQPRFEALTTRTVRFNYTNPMAVAEILRGRLTRDCGTSALAPTIGAGNTQQQLPSATTSQPANCPIRGAVTFDTLTNTIAITEASSNIEALVQYAGTLDIRQPQVNIKAKIILVDRSHFEALGLKYDLGSRAQHFNDVIARTDSSGAAESGNKILLGGNAISAIANAGTSVPGPTLRLVYSAAIGAFDFTTFMDAVQVLSLLDVQAEPSVTTLNYRTAVLSAGTQVPVRTSEPGTGGNAGGAFPQVTVQIKQTGIVLTVTPSITKNREIMMKVSAENSDVDFRGGDVGAVFPTQSITNEVLVADGETAVMGGLTQTSVRYSKTGIPILMDLPLIGRLFSSTSRDETKRDLLILITPHIVDDGDTSMTPRRSP